MSLCTHKHLTFQYPTPGLHCIPVHTRHPSVPHSPLQCTSRVTPVHSTRHSSVHSPPQCTPSPLQCTSRTTPVHSTRHPSILHSSPQAPRLSRGSPTLVSDNPVVTGGDTGTRSEIRETRTKGRRSVTPPLRQWGTVDRPRSGTTGATPRRRTPPGVRTCEGTFVVYVHSRRNHPVPYRGCFDRGLPQSLPGTQHENPSWPVSPRGLAARTSLGPDTRPTPQPRRQVRNERSRTDPVLGSILTRLRLRLP